MPKSAARSKPRGRSEPRRWAPRAQDVVIEEVNDARSREAFARLPLDLFSDDPNYVPPIVAERRDFIDPRRNPFFQHARGAFFLARRGGTLVGRIAALNDAQYNQFHGTDLGSIGLFDCIDDVGVASSLFEAAVRWVASTGPRTVLGPLNLAFHHDVGVLVEGFDRPPSMMMPYNPRYYARLFEANGFTKLKDLYSYELLGSDALPEKIRNAAERARQTPGVTIRRLDVKDPAGELARIQAIYQSMLVPGFGLGPISEAEFERAVGILRPIIVLRPELCFMVLVNGEPAAFSITVPDTNVPQKAAGGYLSRFGLPIGLAKMLWAARRIENVRVLLFGIKPGFRRRGLDALLAVDTFTEARRLGYRAGEVGWVVEDDTLINRTIQSTGARRIKTYRLYERPVGE